MSENDTITLGGSEQEAEETPLWKVSALIGLVTLPVAYFNFIHMTPPLTDTVLSGDFYNHLRVIKEWLYIYDAGAIVHPLIDPMLKVTSVILVVVLTLIGIAVLSVLLFGYAVTAFLGVLYYYSIPFQFAYGVVVSLKWLWDQR